MYTAVTRDIEISVFPEFSTDRSEPDEGQYFWAYTVEIANRSAATVQLMSRHWIITDALGRRQEARGTGVVGQQPMIAPGESFRYTSGCPLPTSSGFMAGTYRFVCEDGSSFDATIPTFSLDSPHLERTLN